MVAMGFSVAAMIRVGNQKGLKNYRELRRIAFSIVLLTTILAVVFAALFMIFNTALPKLYLDFDDPVLFADNFEVVRIASKLLFIAAVFQISDALQVVALGALRGLQDVRIPTIITFVAYWAIGFPGDVLFEHRHRSGKRRTLVRTFSRIDGLRRHAFHQI